MGKKHSNSWAIVVLACTVLLLFVPNYAQYQLSPVAHLVMPAYGLDSAQFSMLFSAAMIPGILLSLVAGLLSDRFGVKPVVGVAAAVTAAALIARIFAPDFGALFACMALTGVVATFLNANIAKIMGSWFPPDKVGVAVGIGLAGSTLAMAVGLGTSALFPSLQVLFAFTAVLAIAALVAWWLFFRDAPDNPRGRLQEEDGGTAPEHADLPERDVSPAMHEASPDSPAHQRRSTDSASASDVTQPSLGECLKAVLKSRNVWLIGAALGLNMAATMCILTFLPQVLQSTRGFDPTAAGALSSVVTFGNLTGSILAPVIIARTGRFKLVAIAFAVVSAAGTAFAWQLPEGPVMIASFFLTGFCLSGLMTTFYSAIVLLPEIGPVYAGTAGGVGATMQLFGAVVIPSYILAPLLGENYPVLYVVAGILCLIIAACMIPLPEIFGGSQE